MWQKAKGEGRPRPTVSLRINLVPRVLGALCRDLRTPLRLYSVTTLKHPNLLDLHGDDDLLARVGLDQVEVRLAHALGLAQLPPG